MKKALLAISLFILRFKCVEDVTNRSLQRWRFRPFGGMFSASWTPIIARKASFFQRFFELYLLIVGEVRMLSKGKVERKYNQKTPKDVASMWSFWHHPDSDFNANELKPQCQREGALNNSRWLKNVLNFHNVGVHLFAKFQHSSVKFRRGLRGKKERKKIREKNENQASLADRRELRLGGGAAFLQKLDLRAFDWQLGCK